VLHGFDPGGCTLLPRSLLGHSVDSWEVVLVQPSAGQVPVPVVICLNWRMSVE
jgi:hypothetical protein